MHEVSFLYTYEVIVIVVVVVVVVDETEDGGDDDGDDDSLSVMKLYLLLCEVWDSVSGL